MKTLMFHRTNEKRIVTERTKYLFVLFFSLSIFLFAFTFNTPMEIWNGSIKLLISPANLVTDYFMLANVGAALVNASLMVLKSLFIIRTNRVPLSGPLLAAIFTVAGFSLFGKTYIILFRSSSVLCYMLK